MSEIILDLKKVRELLAEQANQLVNIEDKSTENLANLVFYENDVVEEYACELLGLSRAQGDTTNFQRIFSNWLQARDMQHDLVSELCND